MVKRTRAKYWCRVSLQSAQRKHYLPPTWNPLALDERLKAVALPARGTAISPAAAKTLAFDLALRGVGAVATNPLVGAVIVDSEHRFVAGGAHERFGDHHAEINAMIAAGENPDGHGTFGGATLYVTLEPCAHHGKTPACAPRVAKAGFARVVFGSLDPNPVVNGRGIAILTAAGVDAKRDSDWAPDAERLADVFLHRTKTGRPLVGLKAAMSLDAMTARTGDKRAWITGDRARQYGHFLRIWYDAVLIGRGTLDADDPSLDPRDVLVEPGKGSPWRTPWRIVLDPSLAALTAKPPKSRRLFSKDPEKILWCGAIDAWKTKGSRLAIAALEATGARRAEVAVDSDGRFRARAVIDALAKEGLSSVLIEGGAETYGAFLKEDVVDRLHLFQAPQLFGAAGSAVFTAATGTLTRSTWDSPILTPLGDDWLIETRRRRS